MNPTIIESLNGVISGLAFVCPNNNAASGWILTNIPQEAVEEALLLIKTRLHGISSSKHVLNIMNLITQLGDNGSFASVIRQHSFHIISHLLTHTNEANVTKSIIDIANSWVKINLITNDELESILNPSKARAYDENLTAGEIANLVYEFKKAGNWMPYTPMDYKETTIEIPEIDVPRVVNQCIQELNLAAVQ